MIARMLAALALLVAFPASAGSQAFLSSILPSGSVVTGYVSKGTQLIANSTAEASVLPPNGSGSLTLPAALAQPGSTILIDGLGSYSARGLAPGTLTFRIKVNGVTVGSVSLANLVAGVSSGCDFRAAIVIGDGGALQVSGMIGYIVSATAKYPGAITMVGSPTVALGQPIVVDVTAQWDTADASNWVMGRYASVRVLRG